MVEQVMPISQLSAILLTIFLLLIPAGIWAEQTYFDIWHDHLISPEREQRTSPRTPLFEFGTTLPDTIDQPITLSASDNPIILSGTTTISPSGNLTLAPGTQIYTHFMSQLIIEGTLIANGTDQQPITFTTNEQHPDDQTWLGIMVKETGRANINHAIIKYGSPGLSCLTRSTAKYHTI